MREPQGIGNGPERPDRSAAGMVWARGGASRRGFSLVELVVVVVLMGALFAIAVPRLDFAKTGLNAAVQQASLTMLSAHRTAIQRQHNVVVAFDTGRSVIRIHLDHNNDGVMDAGELVRQVQLEDGIRFGLGGATARPMGSTAVTFTRLQGGLPAVTFSRGGTASEFGGFYLSPVGTPPNGNRPVDTRALEVERAVGRFERYFFANSQWKRDW
ncbi:MAG: prepilin-type N-terminal cleavage/methylation domain-containing protein [Gemmatimonadetes bacterium]|nr:prepilin-type N-terminal cleavage/methylation domain-containing protein [Gemmatimonadota bacterium]